jgi:pilus assembly protein TadC
MPVTSGYSIIPALDFTATRLTGVVSDEVKTMLALLSSRSASESQAFRGTGERLGEPAAITFFQTLYDAYVDGVKIADTLRSQAEQLRKQEYERKREQLKKLPNTMALIIGLHLMPFLFALTLVPTFYALSSI